MTNPLVLISTSNDPVPVIVNYPDTFPFNPGERAKYREATEEEYARYEAYWDAQD